MSIRRLRRVAGDERGFALISVLVLALLYFAFLELLLAESTEAFRTADRYRARVNARILADNAAELAAEGMITAGAQKAEGDAPHGEMRGVLRQPVTGRFEIVGEGVSTGSSRATATIRVEGFLNGNDPVIQTVSVRR